jgi:hypothetical protein
LYLQIALTVIVLLFVIFIYTFLHESGHAMTGVLFGQSITEFEVNFWSLNAHVGLVGGELTLFQRSVQSMAGAALPLILWTIFITLVPRKGSFTLEALKLIGSMTVINTLLVWIGIPILFQFGKAPMDDVTNFLRYSHLPPVALTFIALVLYIGSWILFLAKIESLRDEFSIFLVSSKEKLIAGTRTTVPVIAGLMAFCAIVALMLNGLAGRNSVDKFSPPQDFALISQFDLSDRPFTSDPVWQFSLKDPAYVGVFIVVRNINTNYFDLSIVGPDGFRSTILHGEGYSASQDGGLWAQNLPSGIYQLVLTSHQSPGVVSIYFLTTN